MKSPSPASGDPTCNLLLPEVESVLDTYGSERLLAAGTLLRKGGLDNHSVVNQLVNDVAMRAGLTGEQGGTRAAVAIFTYCKILARKHGVRRVTDKAPLFESEVPGTRRFVGSRRPDWSMDPASEGYVGEKVAAVLKWISAKGFVVNQVQAEQLRLLPRGVLCTKPNKDYRDLDTGEPLSQAQAIVTALAYAEEAGDRLVYWIVFMDLDGRIYYVAPISLQAADGVKGLVYIPEAKVLDSQGWDMLWWNHSKEWGIRDMQDCREIVSSGIVAYHASGGKLDAFAHAMHTVQADETNMYQMPIGLDENFSSALINAGLKGCEVSSQNTGLLRLPDGSYTDGWRSLSKGMDDIKGAVLTQAIPVDDRKPLIKPGGTTISYNSSTETAALAFIFGKKCDVTLKEAMQMEWQVFETKAKRKPLRLVKQFLLWNCETVNAHNCMMVALEHSAAIDEAICEVLPATASNAEFLNDVSAACQEQSIPRAWETPMGLGIMVLPYRPTKETVTEGKRKGKLLTVRLSANVNWKGTRNGRTRSNMLHVEFILNDGDLSLMPQLIQSIEAAILQKAIYDLIQMAIDIWMSSAHDCIYAHPSDIRVIDRVLSNAFMWVIKRFNLEEAFAHVGVGSVLSDGTPVVNPDRDAVLTRISSELNLCGLPAPS
tara:strand:- start:3733 stop:5700 length:1968 start_codon:yes stop_codon:yes gene_type:complete